ncbi:hypothetical protein ABZ896_10845 [Streptomyces sp. NPDC047072]|uniref:hypothetical protein n=1 Tax=Streptomyces sp. NPDC047072 TaxID=3154809 RepID=UPI0033E08C1B
MITGDVGAGKTMLASEFVLALLERRGPGEPVPVRLALPGWSGSRGPRDAGAFTRWLQERLVDEYKLPKITAHALVTARKVIPVLDGLDEMDPTASALPNRGPPICCGRSTSGSTGAGACPTSSPAVRTGTTDSSRPV